MASGILQLPIPFCLVPVVARGSISGRQPPARTTRGVRRKSRRLRQLQPARTAGTLAENSGQRDWRRRRQRAEEGLRLREERSAAGSQHGALNRGACGPPLLQPQPEPAAANLQIQGADAGVVPPAVRQAVNMEP
jgi:hypothetical protein